MFLDLERTPAQLFSKNLIRIKYVQHIQNDLAELDANRMDLKIQFLNQAYIFQLIAFWQVFIEELARYALKKKAALQATKTLPQTESDQLEALLEKLNVPNREKIDKLFLEGLGIAKVSKNWQSPTLTFMQATNTVADLIVSRHQIAHTGRAKDKLTYKSNFKNMEILMHIAELTEAAVLQAIADQHK